MVGGCSGLWGDDELLRYVQRTDRITMSAGDAIDKACEKIGCSERTVRKAADSVGVLKERVYIDGKMSHWTWELPPVFIPLHKKSDVDAESGSDED